MKNFNYGLGWSPDLPDFRDYTIDSPEITEILSKAKLKHNPLKAGKALKGKKKAPSLPSTVDLRAWCSDVENQGQIGSCTANAGVGLLEYYQRRAYGKHLNASRLFLYKVTRNLLKWRGDTGAYLRTTMKAMAGFGVCPENYWPYSDLKTGEDGVATDPFEKEPTSFCYSFGGNYKSITYYRLDPPGSSQTAILSNIKNYLTAGLPSMFGFTVYNSIYQAANTGKIPFPKSGDSQIGGHAVMIVGFDDNMVIRNGSSGPSTTGAFLIRNSWGTGWGQSGYGYIPYKYVLESLADDFWSLIKADFFDTSKF